jgi:glycerol-3-phosphate acyltransferase PlsY
VGALGHGPLGAALAQLPAVPPAVGGAGADPRLVAGVLVAGAFLAGSVPFGFLIARSRGIDIRKHGSGNIGATNVWRVMGPRWGSLCFLLDFLKGLVPSLVAGAVLRSSWGSGVGEAWGAGGATAVWMSAAVGAVLGHMFTPWLGGKGGKGIATGFGALVGVWPVFTVGALAALVTWVLSVLATRMVGISSVLAAIVLAGMVIGLTFVPEGAPGWLWALRATGVHAGFAAALAGLVIVKHRGNLARTIRGTEPRIGRRSNP